MFPGQVSHSQLCGPAVLGATRSIYKQNFTKVKGLNFSFVYIRFSECGIKDIQGYFFTCMH